MFKIHRQANGYLRNRQRQADRQRETARDSERERESLIFGAGQLAVSNLLW
jgi:hypothetical protein